VEKRVATEGHPYSCYLLLTSIEYAVSMTLKRRTQRLDLTHVAAQLSAMGSSKDKIALAG